jgi:hypothetical protein
METEVHLTLQAESDEDRESIEEQSIVAEQLS